MRDLERPTIVSGEPKIRLKLNNLKEALKSKWTLAGRFEMRWRSVIKPGQKPAS